MRIRGFLMAVLAGAAGLASIPGGAQAAAACSALPHLASQPHLGLAHIGPGTSKIYFVKNADEQAGCPSSDAACQRKAFLVPGDPVMTGLTQEGFTCTAFASPKGVNIVAWLPASALVPEALPSVAPADWLGTWFRPTGEFRIAAAGPADPFKVEGEMKPAQAGGQGATVSGTIKPQSAEVSFASDATGGGDCKIWLHRIGRWLLADDNGQCGGSFRGLYAHKP